MRNIKDLIKKAKGLKEDGLSTGEIADELNVSRETATWLVTYKEKKEGKIPADIYIDWKAIAESLPRLECVAAAMTDLLVETVEDVDAVDVVVGIATSGVPIATLIAQELGASLAIVKPKKQFWKPKGSRKNEGHLITNFADVKGKKAVIVDDIITTGSTITETVNLLKETGAEPLAVVVLIDKKGISRIDKTPVKSLVEVGIVK